MAFFFVRDIFSQKREVEVEDTTAIEKIKAKLGLNDLSKLTDEDFATFQKYVVENEISKRQMEQFIAVIPHIVQLQQAYAENLKSTIDSMKDSQSEALKCISHSLDSIMSILRDILNKSETEELRSKIADITLELAKYGLEYAKIVQEMNKENNNAWRYVFGSLAFIGACIFGYFAGKKES